MKFEIKEDHIKLLQHCYIGSDCGAVDSKRPYGNRDYINDIADILDWNLFEDYEGDRHT